jgi:hypothetical protein
MTFHAFVAIVIATAIRASVSAKLASTVGAKFLVGDEAVAAVGVDKPFVSPERKGITPAPAL